MRGAVCAAPRPSESRAARATLAAGTQICIAELLQGGRALRQSSASPLFQMRLRGSRVKFLPLNKTSYPLLVIRIHTRFACKMLPDTKIKTSQLISGSDLPKS